MNIKARTAAFDKAMRKSRRTLKTFTVSVEKMGRLARNAFIGIAGGVAIAVRAFVKEEEAAMRLKAVLKATGGAAGLTYQQMKKMADGLQDVTTFSDEAIQSTQAILATFKEIKGDEFRRATEAILDMSVVLGQDARSGAVQLGKALNDPIRGITALRRVGVSFSAAQTEMIKKLAEAGKMMKAQGIILAELESEFGGTARAVGETFGGQLIIAKNQLVDVTKKIGKAFVPVLQKMLGSIKRFASWLETLTEQDLRKFADRVTSTAKTLAYLWVTTKIVAWGTTTIRTIVAVKGAIAGLKAAAIGAQAAIAALVGYAGYKLGRHLGEEILGPTLLGAERRIGAPERRLPKWRREMVGMSEAEFEAMRVTGTGRRLPSEMEKAQKRFQDVGKGIKDAIVTGGRTMIQDMKHFYIKTRIGSRIEAEKQRQLRKREQLEQTLEEVKYFREGIMTPVERFKEERKRLDEWLQKGLVTKQEHLRGINRLAETLLRTPDIGPGQFRAIRPGAFDVRGLGGMGNQIKNAADRQIAVIKEEHGRDRRIMLGAGGLG